jgi:protein disulfide-isomerase/protein disulfide-isomerase A1
MLFDDEVKVPLVKVDATVETKLASDHGVRGYPTLKWFVGGSPTEYDGPREADGIVAWIKSMTGPAVVEGEAKDDDKISVTWMGAALEDFEAVAQANRKKAAWYWTKGSTNKMVIKHQGEEALESECADKAAMEKFFADSKFPLFGGLDGETFGTYMEREIGMIWTLLPMTADNVKEVVEEKRTEMTKVARELQGEYSVTWTNTVEFGKVLESMFGITEFPRIVVQTKTGDKKNYIYDGEINSANVLDYVKKVKAGEVEAHLKSEEVPEKNDEPVKVVVGKNLEEMVFTAEKDVLLEVYAPWCGHCKKLDPEYTKVAKKVIKEGFEGILTIAKMDGTQNDSPVDTLTWSGFPTIYYVKAGDKTPIKYDGARDAKGIWKWIKKNHTKADFIKETLAAKSDKKEEDKKEEKTEL